MEHTRVNTRRSSGVILHFGYSHTLAYIAHEQLLGLRDAGWNVHLACPLDEWADRLRADGFPLHGIRLPHRGNPWDAARGLNDLIQLLRTLPICLIHTHNAHNGVIGRIAGRAFRVPTVHTWRYNPMDVPGNHIVRGSYWVAEAIASRAGQRVLFQNEEDLRFAVVSRLVPQRNAVFVSNGIDVERYQRPSKGRDEIRSDLRLNVSHELIVCIARLAERKGLPDLIDAVALLARRRPLLRLVILGSGPLRSALLDRVTQAGITDRVAFLGQRDDVPDILHAADVLVLTSRREGVPRAVMEAMAAGLPVVGTDAVGTRELVRDGETGRLVPFGDPPAIAEAIEQQLVDKRAAKRMATRAQQMVSLAYDQSTVVESVGDVYSELLSTRTRLGSRWPLMSSRRPRS